MKEKNGTATEKVGILVGMLKSRPLKIGSGGYAATIRDAALLPGVKCGFVFL
jgi:hypothetical protein